MWLPIWTFKLHFKFTSIKTYSDKLLKTVISLTSFMLCLLTKIFWFYWDSQFLGRLIRSLGVPKERGVWNSQGRGKDNFFFFSSTFLTIPLTVQSCPTLCDPMDCKPARLLCPWDSPGKNTGVGCHFLLQGISPTQGSNLGLLHCRQMLYPLSHQGSPYIP